MQRGDPLGQQGVESLRGGASAPPPKSAGVNYFGGKDKKKPNKGLLRSTAAGFRQIVGTKHMQFCQKIQNVLL